MYLLQLGTVREKTRRLQETTFLVRRIKSYMIIKQVQIRSKGFPPNTSMIVIFPADSFKN